MDKNDISLKKRKELYDNLGRKILKFHPMLPIYIVASEQCRDHAHQVLLRCGYTMLYSIIDIASLFRAEMREAGIIGKRFGIVKLKVAVSEAFKSIVGASPDDTNALYSQIKASILNDSPNVCLPIDNAIKKFRQNYWSQEVKDARDIAEHFSDKPYEFYQLILGANEEQETKRVNAILAIIQPLFLIITQVVNKEHLLGIVDAKDVLNYSRSFEAIPEKLFVESKYNELGKLMDRDADNLNQFANNFNLPNIFKDKFSDFELNESIRNMLQLFELMMHLEFVRLDTLYTYRAICSSELPLEQRLNLRLMYKTNHEGFKKLYGFKEDKSGTIWGTKIEAQILTYSDNVWHEFDSIRFHLNFLAKQTEINDEHLVVVLTHMRKNKNKDYIPDALIELGNLNIREVMVTSMIFINVLNKIISLAQMMLPEINKINNELHKKSMEDMFKPMNDLVHKINGSGMNNAMKKETLQMLIDSKNKFLGIFN